MMDRRTFIGTVAANLVAFPLSAISQPSEKVYRIGYLRLGNPRVPAGPDWDPAPLRELGWIEGKNLVIEYRYAGENADRLPALARELVRLNVEIIVTAGTDAAVAARDATTHIPIVMYAAGDPVGAGLVARLSGSKSNITGFSIVSTELDAKQLDVLHEVLPRVQRVGRLVNPKNPIHKVGRKEYEEVFRKLGMQPIFVEAAAASQLEPAFEELTRRRAEALIVPLDNLFVGSSGSIMRASIAHALPTMVWSRRMVEDGGLVSYTFSNDERNRRFAYFIDRILRGASPSDLPIEQPTQFGLIINLKTAKALGLTIPQSVLQRAEVIQ
jgi:putative tryptophan/tyrosine transport system substrate-binding protein